MGDFDASKLGQCSASLSEADVLRIEFVSQEKTRNGKDLL